jgi:hypothetical protein
MKLKRNRPGPARARVRCQGVPHRVVWDGRTLTFPDHRGLAKELVLSEIGRTPTCRCAELSLAWDLVYVDLGRVPHLLRQAFTYRLETHRWLKASGVLPTLITVPSCLAFGHWLEHWGREVKRGARPVARGNRGWTTIYNPSGVVERRPDLGDLYHLSQTMTIRT